MLLTSYLKRKLAVCGYNRVLALVTGQYLSLLLPVCELIGQSITVTQYFAVDLVGTPDTREPQVVQKCCGLDCGSLESKCCNLSPMYLSLISEIGQM